MSPRNMRCALVLLVLELLIFTANGNLADIQGGGCILLGNINFQGETCGQLIYDFYIGSGLSDQTPGYTDTVQLQSGQCCIYNTRQSCDKVGPDLRLNVDQITDSECLQMLNVTQSSNSRHGHSLNATFFLVVGFTLLLSLLHVF